MGPPAGLVRSCEVDRRSRPNAKRVERPARLALRAGAWRRLDAPSLAAALERLAGDETMRERAAALGALVRAEEGVGTAVGVLEGVT